MKLILSKRETKRATASYSRKKGRITIYLKALFKMVRIEHCFNISEVKFDGDVKSTIMNGALSLISSKKEEKDRMEDVMKERFDRFIYWMNEVYLTELICAFNDERNCNRDFKYTSYFGTDSFTCGANKTAIMILSKIE